MTIFSLPNGDRIVLPRVLARTATVTRTVVAVPDGHAVVADASSDEAEIDPDRQALGDAQQAFWKEFLDGLRIDDPEQPVPRPPRQGYLSVPMPAPNGSSWLTVYRDMRKNEVGLFLSATRNSVGEYASNRLVEEFAMVRAALSGNAYLTQDSYGRTRIGERASFGPLSDDENKRRAFEWLGDRVNTFVNVMRPRVRSAVADFSAADAT